MNVAFLSLKISKYSGGGFSRTLLHVGASGARLWAPPIQNTLRRP